LKSFVIDYVRERGNGDASEVLDDYMQYLHYHGYVIRRNHSRKTQMGHVNPMEKAITIHLVDSTLSNQP